MCWRDCCGNWRSPAAGAWRGASKVATLALSGGLLAPASPRRMGVQHGASIADGLTTAERSPPRKLARRRGPSHSSDRVCPGDRGHHTDNLASFAEHLAAGCLSRAHARAQQKAPQCHPRGPSVSPYDCLRPPQQATRCTSAQPYRLSLAGEPPKASRVTLSSVGEASLGGKQ